MPIPLSYSYRNLLARRLTTFLTAAGMALVVFVFAAVLMLSEGLRRTLVATGSFDNVVVLRAGSESEVQSAIDRTQAGIIGAQPEVALGTGGPPPGGGRGHRAHQPAQAGQRHARPTSSSGGCSRCRRSCAGR